MGTIHLKNIKVYAFHGCLEEEKRIGSDYLVNLVLNTDFEEAASTDDLSKTIDYVRANKIVYDEMALRSKLLESVAVRISKSLKSSFPTLKSGRVEVAKLSPPMGGHVEAVSVVVEF